MDQTKRTLNDGREISLVSFYMRNLAVDLQAGISAEILADHAIATAKRIWPGESCELLKQNGQFLTQFVCMGEFVSGPLPSSQEGASSLVLIWFQPMLSQEFEEKALAGLSQIDWDAKAKPFSW